MGFNNDKLAQTWHGLAWRIWHLETLSLDGSEDCGGSYRLQIKTISVLSVSPIHIYSLDPFEILLANNIIPHLASELLTIACWLCCTRWKCRQNRTPRTEFKVFMSPMSHVLAFLTIAEIPGLSSGGVAGKCAARKSHIIATAVTAVTVFVVGWPISSVLFEASTSSMIFNDLARNASSTLSLWGCTRCQRPAKANCCFGKRRINIHQNYNDETNALTPGNWIGALADKAITRVRVSSLILSTSSCIGSKHSKAF